MGTIKRETQIESVRFHSPLKNMQVVEIEIERRLDPLSGRAAIYCEALKDKGSMFFGPSDAALMEKLAAEGRPNCFFCPEKVKTVTPRYEEAWLRGGAVARGDCFLFPNLFPLSALHAVIAVGQEHFRRLDDFPAALLEDAFSAAVEFVRSVNAADPSRRYVTINANYLYPAGASIFHPHLQLFGGKYPPTTVAELERDCRRFRTDTGKRYFETLLEEEKAEGARYVAACGPVHWLVPFAPVGTNEVLAIVPGSADLISLGQAELQGLAVGLSRVLAYYHRLGFSTFNFSIYSAVLGGGGAFPVLLRVVCRQNFHQNYRSDDYFLQKLLGEEIMLTRPEHFAAGLREFWDKT